MKKLLALFIFLIIFTSTVSAMKLEKFSFVSNFHIGTILYGPGIGINIGITAKLPIKTKLLFGIEIEQLMTDANYSTTINASRFGITTAYILNELFKINGHLGVFNFQPSTDLQYTDLEGKSYLLSALSNYKGQYIAISLDYNYENWDIIISPKLMINQIIDKGSIREFDLNFGKSF